MKPDEFEKLPAEAKQSEVDRYNNKDRVWFGFWPGCGHKVIGKLDYLNGLTECPRCGRGTKGS